MTTADFSITGSVSGLSPSTDIGAEVTPAEDLSFALEASPALDVRKVQYEIMVKDSVGTVALVLAPADGIATPLPTTPVTTTVPAGLFGYLVRCTINDGTDGDGKPVSDWVRERVVYSRALGVRKMVPGESTQADALYGWVEAFNAMATGVSSGSALALVTPTTRGAVSAAGVLANAVCTTDGVNPGTIWSTYSRNLVGAGLIGDDGTGSPKYHVSQLAGATFIGDAAAGADTIVQANAAGAHAVKLQKGATVILEAGAAGNTLTCTSNPTFNTGTGSLLIGGEVSLGNAKIRFTGAVVSPIIDQATDTTVGGTMTALSIRARSSTVGGSIGAGLYLRSGVGVGSSGLVWVQQGTTTAAHFSASTFSLYGSNNTWQSTAVAPNVGQDPDATASVLCDNMRVQAQGASNAVGGASFGTSGSLHLAGGAGTVHADNLDGSLSLGLELCTNWRAMENGIFVNNVVTAPTGDPTRGGFLYPVAGALTWRGQSGTVTTMAAAGPHCPECGYDHPKLAVANERFGSYYFECAMCGHIERDGPQDVLGMLSTDERADTLRKGDHAHNMRLLTGASRARKRSHAPMLDAYREALDAVLANTGSEEQVYVEALLADTCDEWTRGSLQTWLDSCEDNEPGSTATFPADCLAIETTVRSRVGAKCAANARHNAEQRADEAAREAREQGGKRRP